MGARVKAYAGDDVKSFEFTKANFEAAKTHIAKYPEGRQASAVMPLLNIAQKQCGGWLPKVAMDYIASILSMAPVRVYEVASFYTMYNLEPVGKYLIEICGTTPCWLRGSDEITKSLEKYLGIKMNETTKDGMFTLREVECLGACVNAPMMQIGDYYYEDLDKNNVIEIIKKLQSNQKPKVGTQIKRQTSAPEGGQTTLVKEKKAKK